MIRRVVGQPGAPWRGTTKAVLLELLAAAGAGRTPTLPELAELTGRREPTVRAAIRELETLQVGEYLPGGGRQPGRFAFATDVLESLTGGPLHPPDRGSTAALYPPDRRSTSRARASWSSTSSSSSPTPAPSDLDVVAARVRRRLGHRFNIATKGVEHLILARVERGATEEMFMAAAEEARLRARGGPLAYMLAVLDGWLIDPGPAAEVDEPEPESEPVYLADERWRAWSS